MPKLNRVLDAELLEPIWRQIVSCPACHGAGGVEFLMGSDPRTNDPEGYVEPCEYCNGTGSVEEDIPPLEMDERDEEQVHGH